MESESAKPSSRAVVIGLVVTAIICGIAFFHDCVFARGSRLIPHLMPPVVYGGVILLVLLVNPLLRRIRGGWQPSRGELAVVTALALVACSVPFYGLVHSLPTAVMLPHNYNRTAPGWKEQRVLELVPKGMLADVSVDPDRALNGYATGLGTGDEGIAIGEVPWSAWTGTLLFWLPVILTITLAVLALAVVVHHQWSRNELLPYPIGQFARSLLPRSDGESEEKPVYLHRHFLYAALAVFGIHMLNYIHAWVPEYTVGIPLKLDLTSLSPIMPSIARGGPSMLLFKPRVMFSVIGIAFFFATDVSLSLAVGPVLVCYVLGMLSSWGISMSGGINFLFESRGAFMFLGGYFGIFLVLLYTGRHYYLTVLKRSVGMKTPDAPAPHLVWSMRLFLIGIAAFCLLLVAAGLDLLLAVLFAAIAVMVFVVVSRAVAETGAFYVGTWIMPSAVLLGIFGARALGPTAVVTMAMVGGVIMMGPGWAPMPFAVQGLQLADRTGVDVARVARWMSIAVILGVLVAVPTMIVLQYSEGATAASSSWARYTAKMPFDVGLNIKQRLGAQGLLESSEQTGSFGRLWRMSPNGSLLLAFAITAALAIGVSICRMRFAWWPLHPIVFFFLHSHQAQRLVFSFFVGWLVKAGTNKYGGAKSWQLLKPAMVGLIAGEVLAALVPIVVGAVYKIVTGDAPATYPIFIL
jgi:hypothetical protein